MDVDVDSDSDSDSASDSDPRMSANNLNPPKYRDICGYMNLGSNS